jgi:hypothetical protein
MVALPEFTYHVAQEDWCAYPRHDHDSEWMIINYMVSLCNAAVLSPSLVPSFSDLDSWI